MGIYAPPLNGGLWFTLARTLKGPVVGCIWWTGDESLAGRELLMGYADSGEWRIRRYPWIGDDASWQDQQNQAGGLGNFIVNKVIPWANGVFKTEYNMEPWPAGVPLDNTTPFSRLAGNEALRRFVKVVEDPAKSYPEMKV